MKGDYTRDSFDANRQYTSVRMQQGRVLLDSDWNEQADIQRSAVQSLASDAMGASGISDSADGFSIKLDPNGADFVIGNGRAYVSGLVCNCMSPDGVTPVRYSNQPFLPSPPALPALPKLATDPTYVLFLQAYTRHLGALEAPQLADPAIGATTTRTQTVWQVRALTGFDTSRSDFRKQLADRTGVYDPNKFNHMKLMARRRADAPLPADNCLYRIEGQGISITATDATITLKWSRDNGSFVSSWLGTSGAELRVGDSSGFTVGGYVEVLDDNIEFGISPFFGTLNAAFPGQPGQLFRCIGRRDGFVTIDAPGGMPTRAADGLHPRVRAWDGQIVCNFLTSSSTTQIFQVDSFLEIELSPGIVRQGDYWSLPVRVDLGLVDSRAGQANMPRFGFDTAVLPLAEITAAGVRDLRPRFTSLNRLYDYTKRTVLRLLDRQDSNVNVTTGVSMAPTTYDYVDFCVPGLKSPSAAVNTVSVMHAVKFESPPAVTISPSYASLMRASTAGDQLGVGAVSTSAQTTFTIQNQGMVSFNFIEHVLRLSGRIKPQVSISAIAATNGDVHIFTTRYNDVRRRQFSSSQSAWQPWVNHGWINSASVGLIWSKPYPYLQPDGTPGVFFLTSRRMDFVRFRADPTGDNGWRWESFSTLGFGDFPQNNGAPRWFRSVAVFSSANPTNQLYSHTELCGINAGRIMIWQFPALGSWGGPFRGIPEGASPALDFPDLYTRKVDNVISPTTNYVEANPTTLAGMYDNLNYELPLTSGAVQFDSTAQYATLRIYAKGTNFLQSSSFGPISGGIGRNGTLSISASDKLLWLSPMVVAPTSASSSTLCGHLLAGLVSQGTAWDPANTSPLKATAMQVNSANATITPMQTLDSTLATPTLPANIMGVPNPVATGVRTAGQLHAVAFAAGRDSKLYELQLKDGTWTVVNWPALLPPGVTMSTPPYSVLLRSTPTPMVGCVLVGNDGHIYELGRDVSGSFYVNDHGLPIPDAQDLSL